MLLPSWVVGGNVKSPHLTFWAALTPYCNRDICRTVVAAEVPIGLAPTYMKPSSALD